MRSNDGNLAKQHHEIMTGDRIRNFRKAQKSKAIAVFELPVEPVEVRQAILKTARMATFANRRPTILEQGNGSMLYDGTSCKRYISALTPGREMVQR